jgi:hypothetical protein
MAACIDDLGQQIRNGRFATPLPAAGKFLSGAACSD